MKTEVESFTAIPLKEPAKLKKLRVLLLEDSVMDAELIVRALRKANFEPDWQLVETEAEYVAHLDPSLDVIISDYSLPQFNGLEALALLTGRDLDIPFIMVSGCLGDELAAECIKQGAMDYLLKDRLARLGMAVTHAMQRKQDITERKRAAQELRQSQSRFANVFRSGPVAMSINTVFGGRVIDANEQYCKLFGYSRDELVGKSVRDLNIWANPEERAPLMRRLLAEGAVNGFETKQRLRSGEQRDVVASLTLIELAGETEPVLVSMFTDITDRKRAEEARTAAEGKFRAIIEQSLVGIYVIQGEKFVYLNPKMPEIFGVSAVDLLSRPVYEFIPPEDRELVRANIRKRMEGSVQSIRYTLRIRHGSGELRYVEVHGTRAEYEKRPAIMGTMLDITEGKESELALRQAEAKYRSDLYREREAIRQLNSELVQRVAERTAELSAANARLAEGSKLKDEFLANMSHELRTPLNAILGLSEALLEQISGPLTARQVKSVTTISTSGTHLLSLINDILDLSKIEAGKLELNASALPLDDFCQTCLVFVRTQAMQKHIGVAFETDGRVTNIYADAKRLKQILVNLLCNAVKFTPEGGRIGLTVHAPPGEEVVRFTVWDTGIGIAPSDAQKLFRAFTQIDSGLSRAQEGTGLGLALVAKLAELHGGSVSLESEPDKGSRFTITLPRVPIPVIDPTAHNQPNRRCYRRALLIEDDPTAGAQILRYLTELGISGVLHARGIESVDVALRERPDFILLDILLPDDSGWMVLTRLKEDPATKNIPVVTVSVMDEPGKSRVLGAEAHLTKPITRQQLAEFLQRPFVENPSPPFRLHTAARIEGPLILLAEDNPANVQTIGGYLEEKGCQMRYATNGLLAIKSAREVSPALILMDIQMPVMDGLTAIREIRADAQLKEIPIIALTALAMPGDRERCLAAGATEYICKPVSLRDLLALAGRLLAMREEKATLCPTP